MKLKQWTQELVTRPLSPLNMIKTDVPYASAPLWGSSSLPTIYQKWSASPLNTSRDPASSLIWGWEVKQFTALCEKKFLYISVLNDQTLLPKPCSFVQEAEARKQMNILFSSSDSQISHEIYLQSVNIQSRVFPQSCLHVQILIEKVQA